MRAALVGCVEFSCRVARPLVASGEVALAGVITKNQSSFNSDFASLEPIAREFGAPCHFDQGNDQGAIAALLRSWAPDVVLCLGWPYLLSPQILSLPSHGVIGYHPSDLPFNRGRHPITWAIALGLQETASTYFRMIAEPDAGPIVSKVRVPIHAEDDARSLYDRLVAVARDQAIDVVKGLKSGSLSLAPQDPAAGNSWRKRGRGDGRIDWRMNSDAIRNLVRALTRPYIGAHCDYRGGEIKIWRVRVVEEVPTNLEPGKVLATSGSAVTIKTGDGALEVLEHEFSELPRAGDYL